MSKPIRELGTHFEQEIRHFDPGLVCMLVTKGRILLQSSKHIFWTIALFRMAVSD